MEENKKKTRFSAYVYIAAAVGLILINGALWRMFGTGQYKNLDFWNWSGKSRETINLELVKKTGINSAPLSELDPQAYQIPKTPTPNGLNFIFFADQYPSWEEFKAAAAIIADSLRVVAPWKEYGNFNFYYIKPTTDGICAVKTADERKPVLRCDGAKLNPYLNALGDIGHFKLIVLSRQTFQSWANVARLQDSGIFYSMPESPKDSAGKSANIILFSHLLGHAFGLKDEEMIVLAKNGASVFVPDGPNCAPDEETAKKWWGDLVGREPGVGYFKGCSANPDYVKPTKASLMNMNDLSSLTPTYGPVSERYLKKILDYCFSASKVKTAADPAFFAQYPEFRECEGE